MAGEHSRRPYKDLAFERDLERIWSVEREWEGVQGKWMLKVPMAAGPSRTWRMVRAEVETWISVAMTLFKRLSESI